MKAIKANKEKKDRGMIQKEIKKGKTKMKEEIGKDTRERHE